MDWLNVELLLYSSDFEKQSNFFHRQLTSTLSAGPHQSIQIQEKSKPTIRPGIETLLWLITRFLFQSLNNTVLPVQKIRPSLHMSLSFVRFSVLALLSCLQIWALFCSPVCYVASSSSSLVKQTCLTPPILHCNTNLDNWMATRFNLAPFYSVSDFVLSSVVKSYVLLFRVTYSCCLHFLRYSHTYRAALKTNRNSPSACDLESDQWCGKPSIASAAISTAMFLPQTPTNKPLQT